jgi:transcription elongation factor GreA
MSIQPENAGGSPESPRGKVVPGATVVVKDLDLDDEEEFTLVGIMDVDDAAGKILVDSPLGLGLLHKKVGDQVAVKGPGGAGLHFEIISIRFVEE